MMNTEILLPVLAMMLLAFVVWVYMFIVRVKAMGEAKISAASINTPDQVDSLMPDYARFPAHNFSNMTEVPVLFYVMCFYLAINGSVDSTAITCAWIFVGLRVLHSIVQCTYNTVVHRFTLYLISCVALWVMLIRAVLAAL